MSNTTLDYAIYDADNHYYEPDDCFSRHIEAKYKQPTMWIDRKSEGPGRMYIGDERCQFLSVGAGDVRKIMRDNMAALVA